MNQTKASKLTINIQSAVIKFLFLCVIVAFMFVCCKNFYKGMRGPVVGPPPEKIQELCLPIVKYISEHYEESGSYPSVLPMNLQNLLNQMPYKWSWRNGELKINFYKWPTPLYGYHWNLEKGWYWTSDWELSDEEIEERLRREGYYSKKNE